MQVRETFYRPPALEREPRQLPAPLYNLAFRLRRQAGGACLFVPIRSMQYLAVLDAEEFVFVDGIGRRVIELAWRAFRAGERATLEAPVPYELVCYVPGAKGTMRRLLSEFPRALHDLAQRQRPADGPASPTILALKDYKKHKRK